MHATCFNLAITYQVKMSSCRPPFFFIQIPFVDSNPWARICGRLITSSVILNLTLYFLFSEQMLYMAKETGTPIPADFDKLYPVQS